MFLPLHKKYVNDCYISEELYQEKSSRLIHHIYAKFMRITKITKYLRETCKKELYNNKNCDVTMRLITYIFNTFGSKSAVFEKNIFKIILTVFNHIQKEYSDFILKTKAYNSEPKADVLNTRYKSYLDFLELFYSSEMKTYSSNKYIKMMLENMSAILTLKADRFDFDELSVNETFAPDSTSDEGGSISYYDAIEQNEKDSEYDFLFLSILERKLLIKDILHNFYKEKTMWILTSLLNKNMNFQKRKDILINVIREKTNIVNIRNFLSCFLDLKIRKDVHPNNIDILMLNLKEEYFPMVLIELNMRLLEKKSLLVKMYIIENKTEKENVKSNKMQIYETGEFINETMNCNVIKYSEVLNEFKIFGAQIFEDDPLWGLYNNNEFKVIFILVQWSFCITSNTKVLCLNFYEITKSYLSLIEETYKACLENEKTNHVNSFPTKKLQQLHTKCQCEPDLEKIGIPQIILVSLRTYFINCNVVSEVFYYLLKLVFQRDISSIPEEKYLTPEKFCNSNISKKFKFLILNEIEMHTSKHAITSDDKLIALFIEVMDRVPRFETEIFKILYNIISLSSLKDFEMHGIFCKIRSCFYKTKQELPLKIMALILAKNYKIREKENETTLNLLFKIKNSDILLKNEKKLNLDIKKFVNDSGINNKAYEKAYCENHYDFYYDNEKDEKLYRDFLRTDKKIYTQSVKSTLNLDNLVSKRKSRIALKDFFTFGVSKKDNSKN